MLSQDGAHVSLAHSGGTKSPLLDVSPRGPAPLIPHPLCTPPLQEEVQSLPDVDYCRHTSLADSGLQMVSLVNPQKKFEKIMYPL